MANCSNSGQKMRSRKIGSHRMAGTSKLMVIHIIKNLKLIFLIIANYGYHAQFPAVLVPN